MDTELEKIPIPKHQIPNKSKIPNSKNSFWH